MRNEVNGLNEISGLNKQTGSNGLNGLRKIPDKSRKSLKSFPNLSSIQE